jgi:hypothetical protein
LTTAESATSKTPASAAKSRKWVSSSSKHLLHSSLLIIFLSSRSCTNLVVSGLNGLESLFSGGIVWVSIWVMLSCQFTVSPLYFRIRSVLLDT